VGTAIKNRDQRDDPRSWDIGSNPGAAAIVLDLTREQLLRDELSLEVAVSEYIRSLPFLWLSVDDEPSLVAIVACSSATA
jgi:hypothetical protein